jgi:phosphohistidine phosphatase
MLLYIVRHAFAGQHGDPRYPDDSLRPLTKKGCKRFRRVVKRLARADFAPAVVATSPYIRCLQTAELICERVAPRPKLVNLDALKPGSQLEALVEWSNRQEVTELAWVGHAPDVDNLASALLGSSDGSITFAKGAVAAIEFGDEIAQGRGQLRWCVTPSIMGA